MPTYEQILSDTLADTTEFLHATADAFSNALQTDAQIEAYHSEHGSAIGWAKRVADAKAERDDAIAATAHIQMFAHDYLDRIPQAAPARAIGRLFARFVEAHAEREADWVGRGM